MIVSIYEPRLFPFVYVRYILDVFSIFVRLDSLATFWFWLLFFFFTFFVNRRVTTAPVSILYARYTRRDAYKSDNFRPVRRAAAYSVDQILWSAGSKIRFLYERRIQGATQTTIIITYRVYGTPLDMSNGGASMCKNIVGIPNILYRVLQLQ